MDASTARQIHTKKAGENRNLACSFEGKLAAGETLTGTPTITATPSGLTLSSKAISSIPLELDDRQVAAGKAAQCAVAGGTAGVKYTIKIVAATSSNPAQTLEGYCQLVVE